MSRGPNSPDTPELAGLFDEQLLTEYEKASLQRRLQRVTTITQRLIEAGRSVRRPLDHVVAEAPCRETVLGAVFDHVRARGSDRLKERVARGVAEGVCRHYLWSNASSLPVAHELSVLGPWMIVEGIRVPAFRSLADYLSQELLH